MLIDEEKIYDDERRKALIESIGSVGRMSTYKIGCIVNYLVESMNPESCYLNIGVWKGYTLFSGMIGNRDKVCIGVDNFSEFGGPRSEFLPKFYELKSEKHEFFELDFRKYFELHSRKIGVYYYDALHNPDAQYIGLKLAEPFFTPEVKILVDDWNWDFVKASTNKFISEGNYEIVFEKATAYNGEPTFWNGLVVIQRRAQ